MIRSVLFRNFEVIFMTISQNLFFFKNASRDKGVSVTRNESLVVKRLACVKGINTVLSYPEDVYRK